MCIERKFQAPIHSLILWNVSFRFSIFLHRLICTIFKNENQQSQNFESLFIWKHLQQFLSLFLLPCAYIRYDKILQGKCIRNNILIIFHELPALLSTLSVHSYCKDVSLCSHFIYYYLSIIQQTRYQIISLPFVYQPQSLNTVILDYNRSKVLSIEDGDLLFFCISRLQVKSKHSPSNGYLAVVKAIEL